MDNLKKIYKKLYHDYTKETQVLQTKRSVKINL